VLNLDSLEQLNKQSQWQSGKITRSPRVAHPLQSYFNQRIPNFPTEKTESRQKTEISIQELLSKYTDLKWFHYLKPLDLNYKEDSPRADRKIQSLLPQKGATQIHLGRKRLVVRRYGWIQNIANPLLAPALLPDMFWHKNNAISPEAIKGDNHSPHPKKLPIRLPLALYQDNQDGCDVKSKSGGLRDNKCLCCSQTLF